MNQAVYENDFRLGLEKLLRDIAAEMAPEVTGPYEEGNQRVLLLEHGTRILFFDRLLTLLGWDLGLGGNVAEEARIKAETTRFLDYVGLNDASRAPVLIVEAKAWDKPYTEGLAQAKQYAKKLAVRFTYATNGQAIYGVDMSTGEEGDVLAYTTPDELWANTFAETSAWRDRFAAVPFEDGGGAWQSRYTRRSQSAACSKPSRADANASC